MKGTQNSYNPRITTLDEFDDLPNMEKKKPRTILWCMTEVKYLGDISYSKYINPTIA